MKLGNSVWSTSLVKEVSSGAGPGPINVPKPVTHDQQQPGGQSKGFKVKGFPRNTSDFELALQFSPFGRLSNTSVKENKNADPHQNYGFVFFERSEDA